MKTQMVNAQSESSKSYSKLVCDFVAIDDFCFAFAVIVPPQQASLLWQLFHANIQALKHSRVIRTLSYRDRNRILRRHLGPVSNLFLQNILCDTKEEELRVANIICDQPINLRQYSINGYVCQSIWVKASAATEEIL